jgi:hypothetical protein
MPLQNRTMTLVAFLQAQNCSNLPGSWRHPSRETSRLRPMRRAKPPVRRAESAETYVVARAFAANGAVAR